MAIKPVYSTAQIITQLTTSWGGGDTDTETWIGSSVSFSVNAGPPHNVSGYSAPESSGWVSMDPTQIATARLGFRLWDDLIAISLNESIGNTSARITFNYSSNTGGGTYSEAWWSSTVGTDHKLAADQIWIASGWSSNQDSALVSGGYGLITFVHEIGHSLGLSHPGTYDASHGTVTYSNNAVFAQDNRQHTVMSYFGGYEPGSGWQQDGTYLNWYYPQTPMVDDIAAIQAKYGADYTTRAGDTIYGFNSSFSSSDAESDIYDFSHNPHPIFTIWDASGSDTLDCSGYEGNQTIDLHAGRYSSVDGMSNNVAIAFNCTLENAVGGSGNDTLYGNEVGNVLHGGAGGDTLVGGGGHDLLFGDGGNDTFVFEEAKFEVTVGDFSSSHDILELSASGFGLSAGTLASAGVNLVFGTEATSTAHSLIYDRATGNIYYDSDGTGAQSKALIADFAVSYSITFLGGNTDWRPIKAADFNGDGVDDLLWRSGATGEERIWTFSTDGSLTSSRMIGGNQDWTVAAVGDFNGDGTADLVWRTSTDGTERLWTMSRAGEILSDQVFGGNLQWGVAAIGDFNADGVTDLIWRNSGDGGERLWTMSQSGAIANNQSFGGNQEWSVVAVGDFNQDRTDDVIWRSSTTGENRLWTMSSQGGLLSNQVLGGNQEWRIALTADFNGDGTSDLIWHNGFTGENVLWTMQNCAIQGIQSFGGDQGSTPVLAGDFNGNGHSELLVAAAATGYVDELTIGNHPTMTLNDWLIV